MGIVKLRIVEFGFEALKKGTNLRRKTRRILCQVTYHVKSFFLPIDQGLCVGYYHIVF
jgi:hypothetical protein